LSYDSIGCFKSYMLINASALDNETINQYIFDAYTYAAPKCLNYVVDLGIETSAQFIKRKYTIWNPALDYCKRLDCLNIVRTIGWKCDQDELPDK
jgi:hypothetical protein